MLLHVQEFTISTVCSLVAVLDKTLVSKSIRSICLVFYCDVGHNLLFGKTEGFPQTNNWQYFQFPFLFAPHHMILVNLKLDVNESRRIITLRQLGSKLYFFFQVKRNLLSQTSSQMSVQNQEVRNYQEHQSVKNIRNFKIGE